MKNTTIRAAATGALLALVANSALAATVSFETVPLTPNGYWNGSDESGGITLEGSTFRNTYNSLYDSWSGFAISNHNDTTTSGYLNQYSAYAGAGAGGSANFAVSYCSTYDPATSVTFGSLINLAGAGASFSNATYAALSMRDGGGFGDKKFGGATGNDADWFLLTIEGYAGGSATGTSVGFYLADFRFADNANDYIVDDWQFVDFTPLGNVDELRFSLTSSDNGLYGMNTPAYFAMDDFSVVPEPSAFLITLSGLGLVIRRKR